MSFLPHTGVFSKMFTRDQPMHGHNIFILRKHRLMLQKIIPVIKF